MARKLNWENAKWDSIKGSLVLTGEDVGEVEEAKLREWWEKKKRGQKGKLVFEKLPPICYPRNKMLLDGLSQVKGRELKRQRAIALIEKWDAEVEAKRKSVKLSKRVRKSPNKGKSPESKT